MPLISNTDLQAVVDKLGRFGALAVGDDALSGLNAGFSVASAAVMSGSNSLFTYLFETVTDGDVAADLLPAARNLDESNPVPPSRFLFQIPGIAAQIAAINSHLARYAPTTPTLDTYLSSLNLSTPTLRVHQSFHDHLKSMSRGNVFIANDIVLATFAATGATSGTFTSVATITAYAGAKLVVKNQGAVTTGATLSVTGKKLDGTSAVITATIATGTDNTETNLSSTLKLFTQVTAVSITGGTNANVYEIVAKTDRDISAA